jgi:hypothetical protein
MRIEDDVSFSFSRGIPCKYPVSTTLTYHILGEPDPAVGINIDAYTNAVQRLAG